MNRSDLESKVQVTWEPGEIVNGVRVPFERAVASLPLSVPGYLAIGQPSEARAALEEELRRSFAYALVGDLESENARLREAVERWGRRAISRQFPSRERRNEQDGEEGELKEDLR